MIGGTSFLLAAGVVAASIVFHALFTAHQHHKDTLIMSASLDALTASVTALETADTATLATAITAVSTEIASLKAGTDTAALDALKGRVDTVATDLTTQAAALTALAAPAPA